MLFRPTTTFATATRGAARSSLKQAVRPFSQVRAYSTPTSSTKQSNLPLYLSLGGIAGIGAWYAMGGLDGNLKAKISELNADDGDVALSSQEFRELKLKEVRPYNHDSALYVFELPDNKKSGVFTASCIVIRGAGEEPKDDSDKPVIRPYTPVSSPETKGEMDLLIKHYPNGKMTQHLKALKPGDSIRVKGPNPKYKYQANEFQEIGLIAGGSGVTPMWQLIDAIISNPSDKTKITLLFGNKQEEDILLREKFDQISKDPRFKIVNFLDSPPKGWKEEEGYISADSVKKYLPSPDLGDKTKIFVCGPPGQIKAISGPKKSFTDQGPIVGALADAGFKAEQVFKF